MDWLVVYLRRHEDEEDDEEGSEDDATREPKLCAGATLFFLASGIYGHCLSSTELGTWTWEGCGDNEERLLLLLYRGARGAAGLHHRIDDNDPGRCCVSCAPHRTSRSARIFVVAARSLYYSDSASGQQLGP
jgi:hypothetical protein